MKTIQALAEEIEWFYLVIATGCFSGYTPIAPGTAGTVVAIPLYLLLVRTGWIPYLIISLVLFLIGIRGADRIEQVTEQKDNGIIVIDEIVGYLATMLFLPQRWLFVILGFFVFRLFDILKPYPIRKLDLNPNLRGFGVMIDDVLAGVYGNIALQIVAMLIQSVASSQ
jgi:phosphatidylglycerophosphatase A